MESSRVLVVEDHPISRKLLEAMLSKAYTVVSAASGADAIARARERTPDLILLDIEMPGMDGFQTLEVLRREVIDDALPVIFLSAREDSESRERGLQAGAVDYLTKPYDRHELSIKVKNHLALYEARKEIEARNRIMAHEMEMASQLQSSLLPHSFPSSRNIGFSVVYIPVSPAGGDFYDVVQLPDSRVGLAVVDVSGHGVAAAMIGAMFKMAFQSLAHSLTSPARLLETLNNQMFQVLPDSDFLTTFYAIIDPTSGELVYATAGHPAPFVYRSASSVLERLADGGPLVGAFPDMKYEEGNIRLNRGDKVLVFTDGVTEVAGVAPEEDLYGEGRLAEVFLEGIADKPDGTLKRIVEDLKHFRGSDKFEDDITMLLCSVM